MLIKFCPNNHPSYIADVCPYCPREERNRIMIALATLKSRIYVLAGRATSARKCGITDCKKTLERGGPLAGGRIVEYQTGMGTAADVVVCHDCAVELRKTQMGDDTNPHA